ncbi:MAG: hypothetical protein ACJ786_38335 [Catenulispora sp.]
MKRVRADRARGAQIGDNNTQHITNETPSRSAAPHASGHAQATTISSGDHANVTSNQTHNSVKFNIPFIGPLLTTAAVHPVIASVTAVVVIGGAGVAGNSVLSGSPSTNTSIVRGFQMKTVLGAGTPPGYDFSQTPPLIAAANAEAIYNEGVSLMSTSDQLAPWAGKAVPTGAECRAAVKDHAARSVSAYPQTLICYVDQNGKPGYILVTAYTSEFLTIDTAHLK